MVLCVLDGAAKVVILLDIAISFLPMRPSHRPGPGLCARCPGGSAGVLTRSAFQCDIMVGDTSYFLASSVSVDCSFRASMATWALNSGVYFLRDVFPVFDNKAKCINYS